MKRTYLTSEFEERELGAIGKSWFPKLAIEGVLWTAQYNNQTTENPAPRLAVVDCECELSDHEYIEENIGNTVRIDNTDYAIVNIWLETYGLVGDLQDGDDVVSKVKEKVSQF